MDPRLTWLRRWWRSRIVDPLLVIVKRGTEPKQLAFSAALGITLGLFPICGVTVVLCGFAAAALGSHCHTPTLMLANFVATPIELTLIVPFLRFGEWIVQSEQQFELSSDAFKKIVMGQATQDLLYGVLHVILGWAVAAPVILGALYWIFLPIFCFATRKLATDPYRQVSTQRSAVRLGDFSPNKASVA